MIRSAIFILFFVMLWQRANVWAAPVVEGQTSGLTLVISDSEVVVRETISTLFSGTDTIVHLPNFPAEAEPSSIVLFDRQNEIQLLEWRRPAAANPLAMAVGGSGRQVTIDFNAQALPPSPGVELTVRAVAPGAKKIDLVYVMTGVTWKVTYDVLLRGDLRDIASPISMDVAGWVELRNDTSRTFQNARLVLVGSDSLGEIPEVKPPGFLDLDENTPLADLWRFKSPEPRSSNVYPLENRVDLPPHQTRLVSLVSVTRKPVERILVFRAEEIPTDTRSQFATPSQVMRFENAMDYGGGRAVPPGRAMIHLGNQRSSLHQQAWFKHTPAKGEITLDTGKIDGIRARRVDRGRRDVAGGYIEQVFELRIENTFDKPVSLIIDEQPPITLTWAPLRANQPYERLDRRMIFKPTIEAKSELLIQYTLRLEVPKN